MLETLPRRSDRHRPRGRRRRGLILLLVLFLALSILAGTSGVYYKWATGASGPRAAVTIDIPSGATGSQVASILKRDGVIRSTLAFRILYRFHGPSNGLRAGTYKLTTNMTVAEALDALERPPVVSAVRVTIPEGYSVAQTARRVGAATGTDTRAIAAEANSGKYSLPPFLPNGARTTEGFLFPNTYDFVKHASPASVVQRLLGEFRTEANALPWANASRLGVTPYQVVIIASMIEGEAKYAADRPKVARVIYNRLRRGMPLQIDATVEYALRLHKAKLTYADYRVKSPYNTYLHKGLPPTPICNPGLASLKAALQPAAGDWIYYLVTDRAGHLSFTASYQQFLTLERKYLG